MSLEILDKRIKKDLPEKIINFMGYVNNQFTGENISFNFNFINPSKDTIVVVPTVYIYTNVKTKSGKLKLLGVTLQENMLSQKNCIDFALDNLNFSIKLAKLED